MTERDAELQGVVDLLVELEPHGEGQCVHQSKISAVALRARSVDDAKLLVDHDWFYGADSRGEKWLECWITGAGVLTLRLLRALQAGSVVLSESVPEAKGE